ncbi:citrate transporter [Oscillospiraceae bacterium HV4-5-C5C]|nr:citrate transporter [Oscillospiraceae bacterium HV4-5-C5C]
MPAPSPQAGSEPAAVQPRVTWRRFLKSQAVLLISAAAALFSMLLVKPSPAYGQYLDWRTLILLFCLMLVVAGFRAERRFDALGHWLVRRIHNSRQLTLVLMLLCFFSAMLITNDVSLLTFVPFTILLFAELGWQRELIYAVVLETVAANLGSLLMPVGNPQNLYLYSHYQMTPGLFFYYTMPLSLAGLLLCLAAAGLAPARRLALSGPSPAAKPLAVSDSSEAAPAPWRSYLYLGLFAACLLTVFRLLDERVLLGLIILGILIADRRLFKAVDYGLLLTFVCFFIVSGNLAKVPALQQLLAGWLQTHEFATALLLSQVISNVPAAVLLSSFTTNPGPLLAGTNVGGLGTLIASLASLISFRLYSALPEARPGRFLKVFTVVNLVCLLPLALLGFWLH